MCTSRRQQSRSESQSKSSSQATINLFCPSIIFIQRRETPYVSHPYPCHAVAGIYQSSPVQSFVHITSSIHPSNQSITINSPRPNSVQAVSWSPPEKSSHGDRKEGTLLPSPRTLLTCLLARLLARSLLKRTVERVVEDIAQREQAHEVASLVDDDEAVHAGFADGVEDGVEAVVEGAGVNAGEVLRK
jgi:hypothetical protein